MGFFDEILEKPATSAVADPAVSAPAASASDLLIIDDSVSVASVPDTAAKFFSDDVTIAAEAPSDEFVSAFPETSESATSDILVFDEVAAIAETPAISEIQASEPTDIVIEETVAEASAEAEIEVAEESVTEIVETPVAEATSFIGESFEPVVEAKEEPTVATEAVSDTMSLDSTIIEMMEKIQANVKHDAEKIRALLSKKDNLISESERILAEATAAADKLKAEAKLAEESVEKIEADKARAKKIIEMLTKQIPA